MRAALASLALAAAWILALGTPVEVLERRWLDLCLQWRARVGQAPPADPRLVFLDLSDEDLATRRTIAEEYRTYADVLRQAGRAGARLVVLDLILARGGEAAARPVLDAIREGVPVVLARDLHAPRSGRSFPWLAAPPAPEGAVNLHADVDGTYREYALVHGGREPSLALLAYLVLQGLRPEDVRVDARALSWETLSADGSRLERRTVDPVPLLDFRAAWASDGPGAFRHLSLEDLQRCPDGALLGAILMVGYCGADMDRGPTPLGSDEPRSSLHATALTDLLQGRGHRRTPRWADAMGLATVALLGWAALRRGTAPLLMAWVLGVTSVLGTSVALAFHTPWVPAAVTTVGLWTAVLGVELLRRAHVELLERVRLDTVLQYYFPPRVAQQIKQNPEGLTGAREADLVLLLTDIRNFTVLSEKLGAERVFALLNRVFEALTHAVMDEDGCTEHFLGDQFLAYWGAPEPQADGADRALRAARRALQALDAIHRSLDPETASLFGYGLALHAGPALVGNKGSRRRLDYGIVGDTVNSAARVEALTKTYRVRFLVTRPVLDRLGIRARLVDRVLPLGKSVPVELYQPDCPDLLSAAYQAAWDDYAQGRFEQARTRFTTLAQAWDDGPSAVLAERCRRLHEHPPEEWSGVFQMDHK